MKNLILTIGILIVTLTSFTTLSQTYTVNITKVKELKKKGKHLPKELIRGKSENLGSRYVNCTYVINIDEKTSTFYNKGEVVSKIKFTKYEVKNGVYTIFLSDQTLNEELMVTHIILDTNKNDFIFSWYDSLMNYTRTNTHKEIIKKSLN